MSRCRFQPTGETHAVHGAVYRCPDCGGVCYGAPALAECRAFPRPPVLRRLADLPCPHRRSIEAVETVVDCCGGATTSVDVGHCHRGRHTLHGLLEGTPACVDCPERPPV